MGKTESISFKSDGDMGIHMSLLFNTVLEILEQ
jgi:hypothetical protein